MAEETIQLSKALTKRSRLFGRTSGKYKGQVIDKINMGSLNQHDDDLGIIRKRMFGWLPACFTTGKDSPRGFDSVQDYEAKVKAHKDSVLQHLKNGFELYENILEANATKKIKVGDKEMSVSAAIVYRDQILPMYKDLREFLRIQLQNVLTQSEANDQTAKERAEQWLQNELQSDAKTDSDRIERMRKDYLANKLAKVHDPLKLEEWIKDLDNQIEQEEGDLQTGLYNNNVSTEITWNPTE
jgi:hypothetical protein